MNNYMVDNILCRVDETVAISHTGSAPFCYNGDVLVEPSGILQVVAEYKNHLWSAVFDKTDSEGDIRKAVRSGLRKAIKRLKE